MDTITRLESFSNLSTGHLTEEVRRAMSMPRNVDLVDAPWREELNYMSREYGFFVHVPEHEYENAILPQCIRDAFALARKDGVHWIMFDCDEGRIDALPWYED